MKKRVWLIVAGIAVGVTAGLEVVYRHQSHPVFWWQGVPIFDFLYGLAGCLILVFGAKWLGRIWLQREATYYEEEQG